MSAKIIFDSKDEIPENLRSQATETDGKWELDAKGVLSKNKELLGKNARLISDLEEANAAKEAAQINANEWKGKAKLPVGKVIVEKEIAELGETAKNAAISKDDIPNLKSKIEGYEKAESEKQALSVREEAGKFLGYQNTNAFARLAKDLEITRDGAAFNIKVGTETKSLTKDFVEKHEAFAPFLSSLNEKQKKTPFPEKETEKDTNIFDQIREREKKSGEENKTRSVDEAFGRTAN